MAIRIRRHALKPENLLIVGFASLLALAVIQAGVGAPRPANDFYVEGTPAYLALSHGHVLSFLQLGDVYAGTLELRAPFAMIPALFGASTRTVYYASVIPCMLALVAFAVWVSSQPRRGGHS